MLTLLSEIHFWSTQEDVIIKHTDYGSFKYYSKKDANDSPYYVSKKKYCDQRGVLWNPLNKRPQRLRDKLKELEDHLLNNKIVCFLWSDNQLQLLLSTGLLVNIIVNIKTGDISSINFEKQFAAKLQVNILCDGIILGNQQIICICNDGHVLGFGGHWKDGWIVEGGPRRRLNYHNDWLAVWGKAEAEHPQPWSPLGKDYQRANLHLYWVGVRGPELLAYKKTDGDPIDVVVSRVSRSLIVIEQKVTTRGTVSVEVSCLELVGNSLKRISVTSVPLQTQVSCCGLSQNEVYLFIGCIDGSIALLDRNRGSTKTVKSLFIPKFVQWHPNNCLIVTTNERGQLQYFDTALNFIKCQLVSDDCTPTTLLDLSDYFNIQITINQVNWGPKDLILVLEQGPLILLTHIDGCLDLRKIVQNYLKLNKIDKAIRLLLSWEFNDETYNLLQKIIVYLLAKPMTDEIAKYLQDALGCYHNPPIPIRSDVRNRFGLQVYSLTRRFFHQLVRANMFEMAFLLAVDLGHHDLFMDLHYIAVKIGETEMAAAARAQASALLSRCSSEASNCSRSSCSQCSASNSSDSEDNSIYNKDKQPHNNNETNFLTTNFNQANPKTYNIPPIPDLSTKFNFTPKAIYVKSPQVPANFFKPPPLPFTPPLPNLGIPHYLHKNKNLQNLQNKTVFTPIKPPVVPPLPSTQPVGGAVKKQQAKVKFSDTVTAFIVPEIKRPIRPPPPPHLTDPQKELADSLPLCHPNEDYLKDFTPIRKRDDGEEEAAGAQPKIKVVHFGVV